MEYGGQTSRPYSVAARGAAGAGPGPGGMAVGPDGMDLAGTYVPVMVGPDGQAYIHVSQLHALSSAVGCSAATDSRALPPSAPLLPPLPPSVPDTWAEAAQASRRPFYTLESLESGPFSGAPRGGGTFREGAAEAQYSGMAARAHQAEHRGDGLLGLHGDLGAKPAGVTPGLGASVAYNARGPHALGLGLGKESPAFAQGAAGWAPPGVGPRAHGGATVYPQGSSLYDRRDPPSAGSVHARLGPRAGAWEQPGGVPPQALRDPAGQRPGSEWSPAGAEKPPAVFQFCRVCQLRLPQIDMKAHRAGKRHAAMLEQSRQAKAAASSPRDGAAEHEPQEPQAAGAGPSASGGQPGSPDKAVPRGSDAGAGSATPAVQAQLGAKAGTGPEGAAEAAEKTSAGGGAKPSPSTEQAPAKPRFVPRHCPVCPGVHLTTEGAFRSHMEGRRHAENLASQAARAGQARLAGSRNGLGRPGPGILGTPVGIPPVVAAPGPMVFWQNRGGAQKRARDLEAPQAPGAMGSPAKRLGASPIAVLGARPLGPRWGLPPQPAGVRRTASLGPPFIAGECDVCGASLTTELNFRHHLKGKRHLAAMEALAQGKSPQEARAAGLRPRDKRPKEEDAGKEPGQQGDAGAVAGAQDLGASKEEGGVSSVVENGAPEGQSDAEAGVILLVSGDADSAAAQEEDAGAGIPPEEGTKAVELTAEGATLLGAGVEPAVAGEKGSAVSVPVEECAAKAAKRDAPALPSPADTADAGAGMSKLANLEKPDPAELAVVGAPA